MYYKNLLTQSINLSSISYALPQKQVPELDCPIELDEISSAISFSKDLKTPGLDGIPYARPSLVVEIHKLFTYFMKLQQCHRLSKSQLYTRFLRKEILMWCLTIEDCLFWTSFISYLLLFS